MQTSRPLRIERVHDRVFYVLFDEENDLFKDWTKWMVDNFVRDQDFRVEDSGWPMSPPTVRLVFEDEKAAESMVGVWSPQAEYAVLEADGHYHVGDPEHRLHPW